jgi:hypothetical protein
VSQNRDDSVKRNAAMRLEDKKPGYNSDAQAGAPESAQGRVISSSALRKAMCAQDDTFILTPEEGRSAEAECR